MSRWLPFPLLAVALLAMWLMLSGGPSVGSILLGAVVAVLGGWTLTTLDPPKFRFRRPLVAVRLAMAVLIDIARSNAAVARLVLRPGAHQRKSGFVRIPLETRNHYSLTLLACIITATPGTIWVEYDSADSSVLLHILDLVDEGEWVNLVKKRYERPLMEILE